MASCDRPDARASAAGRLEMQMPLDTPDALLEIADQYAMAEN